jgi:hypothetical protein
MTIPMAANNVVLDAAAVKAAQDEPGPQSATVQMSIKVTISENLGKANIGWTIDSTYAIGVHDTVQLQGDGVFVANFPVQQHIGSVNTQQDWGTGWTASYWSWDSPSGKWYQLLITPST